MGRFKPILSTFCAATLLTAGLAAAQGSVPDKTTFVTISGPVSLPGVTLPAGEYMFRLADSPTNRNIVQIFNKERSKLFATLIAVAAERAEPADDTIITFRETPANEPPALRYWYYPGDRRGQEFVYPMKQAVKIARTSGEAVMAAQGEDVEAMKTAEIQRIDANSPEVRAAAENPEAQAQAQSQAAAQPVTPAETPDPAVAAARSAAPTAAPADPQAPTPTPAEQPATPTPTEQPAATAAREVTPAPAATTGRETTAAVGTSGSAAAQSTPARERAAELPRTASELPLVGLLGFLALGAAFGVRALRRGMIV